MLCTSKRSALRATGRMQLVVTARSHSTLKIKCTLGHSSCQRTPDQRFECSNTC